MIRLMIRPNRHLVEAGGDCPECLQPCEFCDCDDAQTRAILMQHEDEKLRAAADRAIKRGFVQLTRRRSLWARLRDAWYAFWHGLS